MATAQQVKALIESYTERDPERFLSVASQIAAHAARTGKKKLAEELRKLVDEARRMQAAQPRPVRSVPIAQPSGELSGLFAATFPNTRLSDMILEPDLKKRLERVILEYRQVDRLTTHGLAPRRKLLLLGPPGCGKSMTAAALAGELHLPLLTVQFHTLITKFMGETAAKLRLVFDAMKQSRGVYLFDEFDAIGAHRHSGQDVGEIRRVLNSFLVFLEQDDSMGLIIAATNLEGALDSALFRRFDDTLRYPLKAESLENRQVTPPIELLSVREQDDTRYATVYVPEGKLENFLRKIERYEKEDTKPSKAHPSGRPKNEDMVAGIDSIRFPVTPAIRCFTAWNLSECSTVRNRTTRVFGAL
jgi:SpoVK/Ycf46/Vps4 family AAA+-type ATPase